MSLEAIVINPDLASRLRFRDITRAVSDFKRVQMASSLEEGMERLRTGQEIDVLYLSSRYDSMVCGQFLNGAKQTKNGQDSAFLLSLTSDVDQVEISARITQGFDGFLIEPFSVDGLVESTRVAREIKTKKRHLREVAAVRVLVQQAVLLVDELALNRAMKVPEQLTQKKLKRLNQMVAGFSDEMRAEYFTLMAELFEQAAPVKAPVQAYRGPSAALRRRIVRNLSSV